jgi:hypothetical protein
MSALRSSRGVAKLWLSECRQTVLRSPAASLNSRPNWRVVSGLCLLRLGNSQRCSGRGAGVLLGRARRPQLPQQVKDLRRQHHVSFLAALRLHVRMIICSLSMSPARSRTTSPARSPQPYASGQHRLRLQARRQGQDTLDLLGAQHRRSFCGPLMCQTSGVRSWRRSVTRNKNRTPVMIRLRLQMLAPLSMRYS